MDTGPVPLWARRLPPSRGCSCLGGFWGLREGGAPKQAGGAGCAAHHRFSGGQTCRSAGLKDRRMTFHNSFDITMQ